MKLHRVWLDVALSACACFDCEAAIAPGDILAMMDTKPGGRSALAVCLCRSCGDSEMERQAEAVRSAMKLDNETK